jgi:hypothetical protein
MEKYTTICLLFFSVTSFSQKQHEIIREEIEQRNVPFFYSVEVMNGINLFINQKEQNLIKVSSKGGVSLDKVKTIVKDSILSIYFDFSDKEIWKGFIMPEAVDIYVSAKHLNLIKGLKGSIICIQDKFDFSDELEINLESGATIHGEFFGQNLTVALRGGSTATVSGDVKTLKVKVIEGSSLQSYNLNSQTCDAVALSASKVQVRVNKELNACSVNEAVIKFKGEPIAVSKETKLGGMIIHN